MFTETKLRVGVLKANNSPIATRGLVTTAAGPDLCHLLPIGRSVVIRKAMWYNNTGANVTLIFGSQTTALGWLPLMPAMLALSPFDGWYEETHIPDVEFYLDPTAGAAGMTGNIFVQASGAGVLLRLTVEEFGS
jgi:hypothetical protein